MVERFRMHKPERSFYFKVALQAALFFSDLDERTVPKGSRPRPERQQLSERSVTEKRHTIAEFLATLHPSLPYVAVELLKPDVNMLDKKDLTPVYLGEPARGYFQDPFNEPTPGAMSGAVSILAAGLNRFVVADVEGRTLWAGPQDNPQQTFERYNLGSLLTVTESREYVHWLQRHGVDV